MAASGTKRYLVRLPNVRFRGVKQTRRHVILSRYDALFLSLGEAMRRREFISLLGGAAAAWPLTVNAQTDAKIYRIGILETVVPAQNAANLDALRQGLRELGYVEKHNYILEYRSADGDA